MIINHYSIHICYKQDSTFLFNDSDYFNVYGGHWWGIPECIL